MLQTFAMLLAVLLLVSIVVVAGVVGRKLSHSKSRIIAGPDGPIDDLLEGIRMPAGLRRLAIAHQSARGERLVFVSENSEPDKVGIAFADELEKAGYEVSPMGSSIAVAKRGVDTLTMRIRPEAGRPNAIGIVIFPDAPVEGVAIELWPGDRSQQI